MRYNVTSKDVQPLVATGLVPLVLERGSIAAACKVLNEAIRAVGDDRVLHPNRIHALLSDDVARSVNKATIELVTEAIDHLRDGGWSPWNGDFTLQLAELSERAAPLFSNEGNGLSEVADMLGVPQAVLRVAMMAVAGVDGEKLLKSPNPERRSGPDWTYQDVAVSRCLDALRRRPTGNIGLVLPTGAGKTRTALRIILEILARSNQPRARVIWITHRKTLRTQAYRELHKLLESGSDARLPSNAADLAARIHFAMVSEVERLLQAEVPALVIVDEAHHAAALSYQPLFEAHHDFPLLLLTATPNRTDKLPIGIDEIAFTITYRELADRSAIIVPHFEPIPVPDFDWSESSLADLADRLANETADRFTKTLVLVTRIDQVRAFYEAFATRIEAEPDHPLKSDDIGYIHGAGNSHGLENEDFLARFADKPRALLVSAQMLLEGFDDPAIDAVVITYQTESVIKLMQAAGRCVRYAPGKREAYVLQADNPQLAYRFDQRWLYQEIDDFLRPDLQDQDYADRRDLLACASALLDIHHVAISDRAAILEQLAGAPVGASPRLLFYGLPYFGDRDRFDDKAPWGVFVETAENSETFRSIFNGFSELGAELSDPTEYLAVVGPRVGLSHEAASSCLGRRLTDVLTAAYFAREELYGIGGAVQESRPFVRHGPTTWLKYVVFHHRPHVPAALTEFLADCHNRLALEADYLARQSELALAMKIPLPLGGAEGALLEPEKARSLLSWLDGMQEAMRGVEPSRQLIEYASLTAGAVPPPLPLTYLSRLERLVPESGRRNYLLALDAPAGHKEIFQ
ncbi:MAG TPA: DEAD/DEAH box helicase family protein [Allosphingosinicella sp.]|nr:DEAD/DEAH box helicase family protein [Allosphingosinicella sp.]